MDMDIDEAPVADLPPLTIEQFKATCQMLFTEREKYESMDSALKTQGKIVDSLKRQILSHLEANALDKFSIPELGTVATRTTFQVKLPADPEKKQIFFDYLRSNGLENLMTINYNTLNSFYKSKLEEAQAQGNPEFSLPGIDEAGFIKTITMRKG